MPDLGKITQVVQQSAGTERGLPPVHLWNPPFCGDIDIRIARDGSWYHEGGLIRRAPLVKLLSSILKKEGEDYFLVTPVEKMRIRVDDVPFLVVGMEEQQLEGQPVLVFRTLTEDLVPLDAAHPLQVVTHPVTGEPSPYLLVRGGMQGRLNRPVFYELVERAEERVLDGQRQLVVTSAGETFSLGEL